MNSKWHLYISFIKSGIRIFGAILSIIYKSWYIFAISIVIAEILGIVEELGDER